MTAPGQRCHLDIAHEAHPWPGGFCDGLTGGDPAPGPGLSLATLFTVTAHPRPWALPSLPVALAQEVLGQLDEFARHLNGTYATSEKHLLFPCWPLHPGCVHELAALYAAWVEAMQSGIASPTLAVAWHDRHLQGFLHRLGRYFGEGTQRCRMDQHRTDWNPVAAKLAEPATLPAQGLVDAALADYLASPAAIPTE